MRLRPYQAECEEKIKENHSQGVNSQLIILPTGTGKTVIFTQAPKWVPDKRTLVLAHTEELVDQAADKIRRWNPTLRVGVEMASRYCSDDDDVVVGSVPTLGRAGSERLARLQPQDFGVLVVDEAHHATASTYRRIIGHFGFGFNGNPGSRLLLGVTATAGRGDGQGLGEVFDKVTYHYSMLQAIKDGWICPPKGYRIRTDTTLDEVHSLAGDFQQNELSTAVNTPRRNDLIVERWLQRGENRQSLAFTVDIAHAKDLAAAFQRQGVRADAIWGDDPDRAEKLRKHRDGDITVLTNCGVLTEGYDDWKIGCIILARPTKSRLLFVQMVGRGGRLQEGTGNLLTALDSWNYDNGPLKKDFLVLDFIDNTSRHSLITLPSLFGLPSNLNLNGGSIEEAVEELEEAERLNPAIDFKNLEDIGETESYVEHVNLFTEEVDPIITELSKWRWCLTAAGRYVLHLERGSFVSLTQNQLEHWEIHGETRGTQFDDYEVELGQAVCSAERLIRQWWQGSKMALCRTDFMERSKIPPTARAIKTLTTLCALSKQKMPNLVGVNALQVQVLINKLASRASGSVR